MDNLTPHGPTPAATDSGSATHTETPRLPPASVPAGNGTAWWSEGWRLFRASPWVWIAITVLFVVIMILLSIIPLLGHVANALLTPVLAGGVMVGCRTIDRGGTLTINHLFASFSDRLQPLVVVGLFYLIGSLVIVVVVFCALVGVVGMSGIWALFAGDPMEAGFAALATLGMGAMLAVMLGLLIGIPLTMAYWFAPALVVLRHDEPLAAMKTSFNACLVNMWPMLVYSLLGLLFAIVASIPIMLGWLVLAPVFAGSVYASYKDIFGDIG